MTPATKAPPRPRTSAARKATATRRGKASGRSSSARRTSGRQTVRPHRRVSGPARPATARAASASAVAAPLPVPPLGAISLRVLRAGRSLQDSTLLDRLVRGRGWILLLGALLFGLVALNVSLLKLNAAAGHNAERAKVLRIQNAKLRGKVSRLASGDRLRSAAGEMGLVMPEPKKVHYLTARPDRDPRQAARNIRDGTALGLMDDLVSATPEVDSELIAPTPPQPIVESPAPVGEPAAPVEQPAPVEQAAPVAQTPDPATDAAATPGG
jgi:hypothetical protein